MYCQNERGNEQAWISTFSFSKGFDSALASVEMPSFHFPINKLKRTSFPPERSRPQLSGTGQNQWLANGFNSHEILTCHLWLLLASGSDLNADCDFASKREEKDPTALNWSWFWMFLCSLLPLWIGCGLYVEPPDLREGFSKLTFSIVRRMPLSKQSPSIIILGWEKGGKVCLAWPPSCRFPKLGWPMPTSFFLTAPVLLPYRLDPSSFDSSSTNSPSVYHPCRIDSSIVIVGRGQPSLLADSPYWPLGKRKNR